MRDILKGIPDKRQDKNTTSLKFKKDLIEFFGEDYKDKICLEIGTSKGYSTRLLSFLFKKSYFSLSALGKINTAFLRTTISLGFSIA